MNDDAIETFGQVARRRRRRRTSVCCSCVKFVYTFFLLVRRRRIPVRGRLFCFAIYAFYTGSSICVLECRLFKKNVCISVYHVINRARTSNFASVQAVRIHLLEFGSAEQFTPGRNRLFISKTAPAPRTPDIIASLRLGSLRCK